MSETIQTVIAVSVAIIAIYFLLLSVLTVLAYLKLRSLRRYVEKLIKEKLETTLEHIENISRRLEDVSDSTSRKVEDLTDIIPELHEKLQEILELLALIQDKIRNPVLNLVAALKVFSDKVTRWI